MLQISKRMTAFIAALLVAALMAPAIAAAAPAPAIDVPRDHWAYDAVSLMVSKGYMGVYDTGKFVGDDPVSRYLLAFVVAKLLQDVEAGRTALSEDDMRVVKELSTTLREQLAVVISRMGELERLAADASAVAASAQDSTARASLDAAARYTELKLAIEKQRTELDTQLRLNAEASDQKLSALYGDLRNQHADLAGTVSANAAEATAKVDAVENALQAGLAAEQAARTQLDKNLTASIEGVKAGQANLALQLDTIKKENASAQAAQAAAQSAAAAQIAAVKADQANLALQLDAVKKDNATAQAAVESATAVQIAAVKADHSLQLDAVKGDITKLAAFDTQASSQLAGLQLKIDELALTSSANRVWAEGAIAAAREAEAKNRTSAIGEAITAERAAWSAAIASEATKRAAGDDGLDKRLAALELNLTSTAAAAAAATTTEAAVRAGELDALNKRVADLAAEFKAGLDASNAVQGGAIANLSQELDAESAARAGAIAAERAAWEGAIAAEATKRATGDEGLDKRLAALELNLTSTAAATAAATSVEAAVRAEGLEALNKRIAQQAAEFSAKLDAASAVQSGAIANLSQKLDAESAATTGAIAAERAAWEGAVAAEATKRAAGDEGLDKRLAALELNLTSTAAAAAAATTAEASVRVEGLEALNKRIAEQAAEFSGKLAASDAAQDKAIAALSLKLDAESAARVSLRNELLDIESRLRKETNASLEAAVKQLAEADAALRAEIGTTVGAAIAAEAVARDAAVETEAAARDTAVRAEAAARDAAVRAEASAREQADNALRADLEKATQGLSLAQAGADQRVEAELRRLKDADAAHDAAIAAESSARQKEAAAILEELRKASASVQGDLERKMAEADQAIIASMESQLEAERARLSGTQSDLAQLAAAVRALESKATAIQAQLDELGKKQGNDFAQQRQALIDLKASLDLVSKQVNDKIAANAAEDARTASKVLENTMAMNQIVTVLNETRTVLNDTIASLNSTDTDVAALEARLASMEKVIQGSVEELKARFADDIVAERWEAEAREIKLQQMIEDLQRRVEQLEAGNQAKDKPAMSTGAILGIVGGIAAVGLIIALTAGGGGSSPTP